MSLRKPKGKNVGKFFLQYPHAYQSLLQSLFPSSSRKNLTYTKNLWVSRQCMDSCQLNCNLNVNILTQIPPTA